MNHAMANQTQRARSRLLRYETKWKYLGPENKIRDQRARHAELERRYTDAMEEKLKEARHRLALYIQAMKGSVPAGQAEPGTFLRGKRREKPSLRCRMSKKVICSKSVYQTERSQRAQRRHRPYPGWNNREKAENRENMGNMEAEEKKKKEPLPVRHWKQHLENWIRCSKRWRATMSAWKTPFVYTRREWSF